MKVVVCVRRLQNGELNPFDGCAYEAALRLRNVEVTLLSMGPMSCKDFLSELTRLGAERGILLSDSAFAGADTLATAYTLSLALKRLAPDIIICGRQTVDGDTGQVGPELAAMLGCQLAANVMEIEQSTEMIVCKTRLGESIRLEYPTLITLEKINTLRLPSLRSKRREIEVWNSTDISADILRTGLRGSPTKVIATFQNEQDRRSCRFISKEELPAVIHEALNKEKITQVPNNKFNQRLKNVWVVGEAPLEMAKTVSDDITVIPLTDAEDITEKIKNGNPNSVIWGSDLISKRIAPMVAAKISCGLCADCTLLETDGDELYMYRPAFSGNIIAKIKCISKPKMATVRTNDTGSSKIAVGLGFGIREQLEKAKDFAAYLGAEICATRKMVDNDYLPYESQVGLTGKSISPDLYIAIGISGAIHHIAGMKNAGTVIAINSDKDADIFKYADYGLICDFQEIY